MKKELGIAMEAARAAGQITLKYYGGKYEVRGKADSSPVTAADLESNAYLLDTLGAAFPEYGWLSEETVDAPERLERQRVWIVDPIDGTKEFVDEIPEYCVSIALVEEGEPVVGVIYNPATEDMYSATHGGGTFLNGKRVFCSETTRLDQATMIVSRSETKRGEIDRFKTSLKKILPLGSVAFKLAVVAAGRGDLNISVAPKNEWDVCAGDLLVREAGGQMFDLSGTVRRYNQQDPLIQGGLVAGNPDLAQAALRMIAEDD